MACGCAGINAGEFRDQIIIEKGVSTPDGFGGRTTVYSTFRTLNVKVQEKSGNENFARQNQNTNKTTVFTTWYDAQVEPDEGEMRILYRDKVYDFTWSENIEGMDTFMRLTGKLNRMKDSNTLLPYTLPFTLES